MVRLPTLSPKQVIRVLERLNFALLRIKGSHHFYSNQSTPRKIICVPVHNKDLKKGLLLSIIRATDSSKEQFLELL